MKSSTVLSFFLPVITSALPQGPLQGLTAGLTGTVGGLAANAGVGAGFTGSGSSGSSYNAGSAPVLSSGYNATHSSSSDSGAGGLVGGLPLVGGLLGGGGSSKGAWSPCAGVTGSAQCCATDVLGVADLDCLNPTRTPGSRREFGDICSAKGQRARCCALPVLGQALICSGPV